MCDTLNSIRTAYNDKKLIPFIGSGFSIPLGLPNWNDLIAKTAIELGYEPELFTLHGNNFQLLEYVKQFHESEWENLLHDIKRDFDSSEVNAKRESSITHIALSKLDKIKTIYTTNYDLQIENSLKQHARSVTVLSSLKDFIRSPVHDIDCEVIKFHGTLKQGETLILTETEYLKRMNLEEPVDLRLRSDILSNSFLFIGYSFNDPNIRYIWFKINELKEQLRPQAKLRPSYFVTFGGLDTIQNRLLERWGIISINLDPGNKTEDLAKFIESIGV
ncbi:SIR2 family protein [Flavihumibacter sp. R14]|nr:SIR2 family protein [Flavihumibacter soli]